MYLDRDDVTFEAGHASAGAPAPAAAWHFAEGKTGAWFDEYLLLANPSPQAVEADVSLASADGARLERRVSIPAQSRVSLDVEHVDAAVADADVTAIVRGRNGAMLVAERALWWGGSFAEWIEAHASFGATMPAARWLCAAGEVGGSAAADTFVLVANGAIAPREIRVTLLPEGGGAVDAPFTVAAGGEMVSALKADLAIPPLLPSNESIVEFRAAFEAALDRWCERVPKLDDPLAVVARTGFYLAYQGRDDRDLQVHPLAVETADGALDALQVAGVHPGGIFLGKSLALDAADRAHVVYNDLYAGRLVYLRQIGNGWQTLAEPGASYTPSLALDATGRPHVAFTNGDEDLVYAVLGNDGWERTTIPMVGHGGGHNTLLLDETGAAHISTMQIQQNLYYATNRGGAWAAMPVAVQDVVGEKHALALDTADHPHLLYYHASLGQLRWAGRDGGAWATSAVAEVDDSPLRPLELAVAFGPNDVAQIAYVDGAANELVFGTRQGDGWLLAPITTAGSNLALTVGPDNRPHLILIQDNRLAYWAQQAGTWQREWISAAGEALFNAFLALDDQNRPHVVYTADGVAIEAVRQGAADWQMEVLPVDYMIGMALGPEGSLHLLTVTSRSEGSRPPFTFYTLWLSERVAGEWTQRALFEDAFDLNALSTTRVLVEPDRSLHVVSPYSFDRLSYLRRAADGQWSSDSIAGPGSSFALAVGSDGQPRVSRHENTDLRLYTREILWLDKHMLLPVVPIKSPW